MLAYRTIKIALLAFLMTIVPASAFAGVFVSITVAPPVLPVYAQPVCPGDGYLWTPGYWAYGPAGYYWVPGTWVMPPTPGLLWTPGYWGFAGGIYAWHAGFWGPHIGFYGGVNYGYGYPGAGFYGGRWQGGHFFYNTAVLHVNNTVIHNTYVDRTVIHETVINRTSFNGPGGINARANAQEEAAMRGQRFQPTAAQESHERFAGNDHQNFASVNGGRPAYGATSHPMTSANTAHASFNNNSRPAYNAANNHPANNGAMNNHPAYNNNANYRAPVNNQQHANEQFHGGGQPPQQHPEGGHPQGGHPESGHPEGGHGGGEHGR
jgi:hypothetical protein